MRIKLLFLIILPGLFLLAACNGSRPLAVANNAGDGRYDSEFPDESVSDQLDEISESVKKIDCLAFYMTYVFSEDNTLKKGKFTDKDLRQLSSGNTITNQSVSGTVNLIYYDGNVLGMLTCAHVVDFADTIYNWYDEDRTKIYSVSIKLRQQNYVAGLPEGEAIEVVAMDRKNDIAILRKKLAPHVEKPSVMSVIPGKSKDLEWGTFVYILGYPLGHLMVTRALVSNPEKVKGGVFLTDALYNKGISGGPVLALRDGSSHFEWVGMAKSASVENIIYLKPDEKDLEVIDKEQPYKGAQFIEQRAQINYGITYSVTIDAIQRFFNVYKEEIRNAGIYLDQNY